MLRGMRRPFSAEVPRAMVGGAVLLIVAACGPTSANTATGCRVARNAILTAADLPSYTQFVAVPRMEPPVRPAPGSPLPLQRQYICGSFYGFIADPALRGRYRQEDDTRARRLGYTVGKWPLVPLTGSIVTQLRHQVLEIYEGLYQFTSPRAVAAFLSEQSGPGTRARLVRGFPDKKLPIQPLPGAIVIAHTLGPQPSVFEHSIFIGVPIGNFALTLSIQGGQELTWRDAYPYWQMVKSHLRALESR